MEPFRTVLHITTSTKKVTLKDSVFTCGSCFSGAIGTRLQKYKIHTLANPFGNIYNPHSIHKVLKYSVHRKWPGEETYLDHHGIHVNYDFHSEFSAADRHTLSSKLNNTIDNAHTFLKNAAWLIITYGTSWVYEQVDSGNIVANCHKMPSKNFKKRLLTQKKILESFNECYHSIKSFNPSLRIIVTVSPVRHIKDTLELNSLSKAILRATCHSITETFEDVEYFPSFEIMMDDLRDYRFYKADMLHPTDEAEDYIWHKFTEKYFDDEAKKFVERWKNILQALSHKPFHPTSHAHQQFLKETLDRLRELKPLVNVDKEMALVQQQLISGHD